MAGNIKRQQTAESESQVNTRQDRNVVLADGGTWTWNAPTLTWSGNITLHRSGLTSDLLAGPDSVATLDAAGKCFYALVNRTASGGLTKAVGLLGDAVIASDDAVVLAYRGLDGKIYFRNGTVMSEGDSKTFGTLNSVTDRTELAGVTGQVNYLTGFDYGFGLNQLAVYVGGLLLKEGTHYSESASSPGNVDFIVPYLPTDDELITFMNIVGGQGPAGAASPLQDNYNAGRLIELPSASVPVQLWRAGVESAALAVGEDAIYANAHIVLTTLGRLDLKSGNRGLRVRDNGGVDYWNYVPAVAPHVGDFLIYNTGSGFGFRLDKSSGTLVAGSYAGVYPSGTWTDEGSGGLRWEVATGTIPANPPGAPETVNLGLSTMIGVLLSVADGNVANTVLAQAFGLAQDTNRQFSVTFNNTSGDIEIRPDPASAAQFGAYIENEPYTLIVFHQG